MWTHNIAKFSEKGQILHNLKCQSVSYLFSGKVEIVGYSFIGYCNTQSKIHLGIKTKIS